MELNRIIQGHTPDIIKTFPDESIDCGVTSPPFWALRDYQTEPQIWGGYGGNAKCQHEWGQTQKTLTHKSGETNPGKEGWYKDKGASDDKGNNFCSKCGAWRGSLGLEPDFNLYIKHLCDIFDEFKRTLKKTGTLWVNIGDTYGGSQGRGHGKGNEYSQMISKKQEDYAKSLCQIPARFAIAMTERGWILRNKIIWHKQNCMPSSVKDRFTVDYEEVFFFVKSSEPQYWVNNKTGAIVSKQPAGTQGVEGEDWEWIEHSACKGKGCNNKRCVNGRIKSSFWEGHDYWFEQQFDEYTEPLNRWGGDKLKRETSKTQEYMKMHRIGNSSALRMGRPMRPNEFGRNKRCVWSIPTRPFKEAHFATFPEALIEPMIKAGCPEFVCKKCGRVREKILEPSEHYKQFLRKGNLKEHHVGQETHEKFSVKVNAEYECKGYTDCGCGADFEPGVILDPFMGAGTTAVVAKNLGRNYIGIELNPKYIEIAERRLLDKFGMFK